jgi:tetratricopeptide (TPR) repeat protein
MHGRLTVIGGELICSLDQADEIRIPLSGESLNSIEEWNLAYRSAVERDDVGSLLEIGHGVLGWLDVDGWAGRWLRGTGARWLEVAVDRDDTDLVRSVLDLPWELLADDQGFLAADPTQPLVVVRTLGRDAGEEPTPPAYSDLALMFMAASPEGQLMLDFELEEAAILAATDSLYVQVLVEESGCATFLKDRLAREGPFDVVHVSCHGGIQADVPVLALETPEGELELVRPGDFVGALGEDKASLVFVSACGTAESRAGFTEPFVRALVRSGVRNVLGWDGSVYDSDATQFTRAFYRELSGHASVPFAASAARRELLRANLNDASCGRHWHLARVYAGAGGTGACCGSGLPKRRIRRNASYKEFLDKAGSRVPVATAREFVGRRREAQAVLRAFRDLGMTGVLVSGMGNIGKSSLAARVANRMPRHRTIVVYERYDGMAIFEQLLSALPASERAACERTWRTQIAEEGGKVGLALEEMLETQFDAQPILLVIDDLEQILDPPRPGQLRMPVADAAGNADAWRASLRGVLNAFVAAATDSRLLLTSRYDFTLPDGRGRDLADGLKRVRLPPMNNEDRARQWRAVESTADRVDLNEEATRQLVIRAQLEAGGNPGLQEILCRPLLSGELAAARDAMEAVAHWKSSGKVPNDDSAAQEFFQRVSFETYRDALSEHELAQLRAGTVFSEGLPAPVAALEASGSALGVRDPPACLRRLVALGLVDDLGQARGKRVSHAAVNPLARSLGGVLSDAERSRLAGAVIAAIDDAWRDERGEFPLNAHGVEAARLALAGDAAADVLDSTGYAAGLFLFHWQHDARAALDVLQAVLAMIDAQGSAPHPRLLRLAADCAERVGENALRVTLLEQGLHMKSSERIGLALIAADHAVATLPQQGPERALATLLEVVATLEEAGEVRERAVTMGQIADILQRRGDTDEALRIRREEELPVYERLGDVHAQAVTMGQIADILQRRGDTDEALRIRREEELPVYERLGDVHARAVTMGQIADILEQRGDTDEALRIHREEELPVYERLGDVHARAVTMGKIADVLQERGDTDEALRIRREEQLPVYERLDDVRGRAVTMGKIAGILRQRGDTDEALRIHREEQLPVFDRLGDVRARAVTMGKIADILQQCGDTDEALRIHREEQLPVFERLDDVRERAVTMGKIADILQQRGDTDEALRIHIEDRLPVAQATRDMGSIAHIRFSCAQLRISRGGVQPGELQLILDELAESFGLLQRLQRVDGIAVVGGLLGVILSKTEAPTEAVPVLNQAAEAFERLGDDEQARRLRAVVAGITTT